MKSASRLPASLLAAGFALFGVQAASATVLFSDDFSYANNTQGSDINKWTLVAGGQANPLFVSGGELAVNSSSHTSKVDRLAADLGSTFDSGSLFVGFDVTMTDFLASNLNLVNFASVAGGGANADAGGCFNVIKSGTNFKFGVSGAFNVSGAQTAGVYALNTTYRAVVEYKFVTGELNNEARLYIDGVLVATSLYGSSPVEVAGFRYVGIKQPTSTNSAGFLIDDLVVSTTYAEAATFPVSAVPEPSAYAAILGGAALAVGALRRRRS